MKRHFQRAPNKYAILKRGQKRRLRNLKRQHRYYIPLRVSLKRGSEVFRARSIRPVPMGAPVLFDVEKHKENVVGYLSRFNSLVAGDKAILDFTEVECIDTLAITMLLSQLYALSSRNVRFEGNMPHNEACKLQFIQSGFLDHVSKIDGQRFTHSHQNLILELGRNTINSRTTGEAIKKAMERLLGEEQHYEPAQSIIIEIAGNSIEHAYSSLSLGKHWMLSVAFDKENCVQFALSDAGSGIMTTLNRKFGRKLIEFMDSPTKILERAFDMKYGSVTNEPNRNKGLPMIKRIFSEGKVKSLKVITNNVYLDFENPQLSAQMTGDYSGTVYAWEIDKDIIEKWMN